MRVVYVFLVALLVSTTFALRPKWHELEGYTFERFEKDFGKKYGSEIERAKRKAIFEESLHEAKMHNSKTSSYKKGINKFSDWTKNEFQRLNGAKPRQMHHIAEELRQRDYVKVHKSSGVPLPKSVDWRNRAPSVLSAVKDQGQCGSCWAHGSTENIETYYAIATGQMYALSQQEITACAPNPDDCGGTGGCGGSIAELAFDYVKHHGMAQEWSNPYTAYFGTTGNCTNTTASPVVWLDGYVKAPANDQESVMDILAHTGPLSVNVDASEWGAFDSGIYDGCHYAKNISIDHVVQLVGYGHEPSLGMDYWIIRNSWSPDWGENGYIKLKRTSTPACGWDVDPQDGTACRGSPNELHVCGECGILWDTSYPIVKMN